MSSHMVTKKFSNIIICSMLLMFLVLIMLLMFLVLRLFVSAFFIFFGTD